MNIFDILGPVMVGPSSSHTAGAVRIGQITRRLLGKEPVKVKLLLHGSFALTGAGHGTHKALIAGLLGFSTEDERIPISFDIAREKGMEFTFGTRNLRDAHPNSVLITAEAEDGSRVEVGASSPGGGRINVFSLDGLRTDFSGTLPTIIVKNADTPGWVSRVSAVLAQEGMNVATLRLERQSRGGSAIMVIECDQPIPEAVADDLRAMDGIYRVTLLNPEWEE